MAPTLSLSLREGIRSVQFPIVSSAADLNFSTFVKIKNDSNSKMQILLINKLFVVKTGREIRDCQFGLQNFFYQSVLKIVGHPTEPELTKFWYQLALQFS